MSNFNYSLLALIAVYYNIVSSLISFIFLIILLITYSTLKDLEHNLLDPFLIAYAKILENSLMFIWFLMEGVGPLICIRAIIGIHRERVDLVAQYLVWKSILTATFCFPVVMFFFSDSDWDCMYFPLPSLIMNALMLLCVYLFYRTMPDDSSSEDEA